MVFFPGDDLTTVIDLMICQAKRPMACALSGSIKSHEIVSLCSAMCRRPSEVVYLELFSTHREILHAMSCPVMRRQINSRQPTEFGLHAQGVEKAAVWSIQAQREVSFS